MAREKKMTEEELGDLHRIVFPHLGLDHVRDMVIWSRHNQLDPWKHIAGEVREEQGKVKLVMMVKLSGLLARADASGLYSHIGRPEWERDPAGKPIRVHVPVYRWFAGEARPCWGTAAWANYYPGPGFWDKWGEHQLWKCGASLGVKLAVPDLLNLYSTDEMAQYLAGGDGAGNSAPRTSGGQTAHPEDDAPRGPTDLKLRMVDFGFKTDDVRDAIIRQFRETYRHMDDSPVFYAAVYRAISENPELYGGHRPNAA